MNFVYHAIRIRYEKFEAALNATGRAMVHSVKGPCGRFGQECSPSDASSIANLRRAAGDVHDNWDSILRVLEKAAEERRTRDGPGLPAEVQKSIPEAAAERMFTFGQQTNVHFLPLENAQNVQKVHF